MRREIFVIGAICLLGTPVVADAVPITLEFTASGFSPFVGSDPAPQDPISGSIVYEAASIGAPMESLISIDLTIAGYLYSLSDVSFESPYSFLPDWDIVYGSAFGINILPFNNVDDFWLLWDRATGDPVVGGFAYTTASGGELWTASTYTVSRTIASVPEPATLSLLGAGLTLIGFARRRLKLGLSRKAL